MINCTNNHLYHYIFKRLTSKVESMEEKFKTEPEQMTGPNFVINQLQLLKPSIEGLHRPHAVMDYDQFEIKSEPTVYETSEIKSITSSRQIWTTISLK